ncbi:hypothetical protein V6N11_000827 [Hibiscus sabdariffa]|uniref:Uncharacterized protein n=1 Tax=Hibiscus sabdariffa TaxID=183260 RepID=A0ABR2RYG8_9ROSI
MSEQLPSNSVSSADVSDAIPCHSNMQCQFTCPHSGLCNMVTHKCACNPMSEMLPSDVVLPADVSDYEVGCHSDMQCQVQCPHSGSCNMIQRSGGMSILVIGAVGIVSSRVSLASRNAVMNGLKFVNLCVLLQAVDPLLFSVTAILGGAMVALWKLQRVASSGDTRHLEF